MSLFMIQLPKVCLTAISLYAPNGILSLLNVLFGSMIKALEWTKRTKEKKVKGWLIYFRDLISGT